MPKYIDDLEKEILDAIEKAKMDELLLKFDKLDRLSGSSGEKEGIDYITGKLEEYGVKYELNAFDSYLSNPISATLDVLGDNAMSLPAKTRSYSGNCEEGVEGELIYLSATGGILFDTTDIFWTREEVEGKIVISEGGGPQHVDKAAELGAVGLIHVWPSKEDVIHEMISTPVWGVPTPETKRLIPPLPEVSVKNSDGLKLIELAKKGTRVRISTHVKSAVTKLHLPVALIEGKTDEYVLLAGHIDSWHVGITDNAVGNALCLELARVFNKYKGKLERGVKIAWWPGHSNGRYAGSTWYSDNKFADLKKNCVAYINSDSPGSKNGVIPIVRSTLLEKDGFFEDIVREVADCEPEWGFPIRAGDNSLWGTYIPFHVMLRDKPAPENADAHVGGSGGGWWWHSEQDTYDKADLEILLRDAKINASFVYRLAQTKVLPVDFVGFVNKIEDILAPMIKSSLKMFDFSDVTAKLAELRSVFEKLDAAKTSDFSKLNQLYKSVGGRLAALVYTTVSPYYHDVAYDLKPMHGLYRVSVLTEKNTTPDDLLFYLTDFVRQKNRFCSEIDEAIVQIENYLS